MSQTEGSEELRSRGLEVVGWYHSHPTFKALPSVRDVHTQVCINHASLYKELLKIHLISDFRLNSRSGSHDKRPHSSV